MQEQHQVEERSNWIKQLAQESWQGELIISGIAIFGSFQLPELMKRTIDACLYAFTDPILDLFYLIFVYLGISSVVLVLSFVLHFVLRSLWIGMVGLISVFPEGINSSSTRYSQDFLRRANAEFGEVYGFVEKLDRWCSVIFSVAFGTAMTFLSIAILILTCLLLSLLIQLVVPSSRIDYTIYLLVGVFIFIPSMIISVFNWPSLRDKPWVQRLHFPIFYRIYARLIYNVFFEPLHFIYFIFLTNTKKTTYGLGIAAMVLSLMGISMAMLASTNILFLRKDIFFYQGRVANEISGWHYADQLEGRQPFLMPYLPTAHPEPGELILSIPLQRRWLVWQDSAHTRYQEQDGLPPGENRRRRIAHEIKQLTKNFQLKLNQQPIKEPDFQIVTNGLFGQRFAHCYLPDSLLRKGYNLLTVEHRGYRIKKDVYLNQIPFWVAQK